MNHGYERQSKLWKHFAASCEVLNPPLRGIVQLTNSATLRFRNWSFTNKYTNLLWRVACIAGIFTLFVTGCAQAPPYMGTAAPPHTVLSLHPETTFQTMAGFGAGFNTDEYIKKIFKPEDQDRAYDLLYGPQENGGRLNIVRLVVSNTAQEVSESIKYIN